MACGVGSHEYCWSVWKQACRLIDMGGAIVCISHGAFHQDTNTCLICIVAWNQYADNRYSFETVYSQFSIASRHCLLTVDSRPRSSISLWAIMIHFTYFLNNKRWNVVIRISYDGRFVYHFMRTLLSLVHEMRVMALSGDLRCSILCRRY